MEIKIDRKIVDGFRRGVKDDYLKIAEIMVANFHLNSETMFKLLVDLANAEGESCGDCNGLQCATCWRGFVVVYASKNTTFFQWLHGNKEYICVDIILKGLSDISSRGV